MHAYKRKTITRVFEWVDYDPETDKSGWVPLGMKGTLDPGMGLTVAHDALEHFDPKDPCIEQEGMAFGCMAWGRGSGYYFLRREHGAHRAQHFATLVTAPQDIAVNMSYDIGEFLVAHRDCKPAPASAAGFYDHERFFTALREETMKRIVDELQEKQAVEEEDVDREYWLRVIDNFIGWIKVGFVAAEHKYGALGGFDFCDAFKRLEKDRKLNEAPESPELQLVIVFDRESGEARTRYKVTSELAALGYSSEYF